MYASFSIDNKNTVTNWVIYEIAYLSSFQRRYCCLITQFYKSFQSCLIWFFCINILRILHTVIDAVNVSTLFIIFKLKRGLYSFNETCKVYYELLLKPFKIVMTIQYGSYRVVYISRINQNNEFFIYLAQVNN